MEWEAQDEGFLAKILVAEGTKDIAVGTPVAVVVDEADDVRLIAASGLAAILLCEGHVSDALFVGATYISQSLQKGLIACLSGTLPRMMVRALQVPGFPLQGCPSWAMYPVTCGNHEL